MKLTRIVFSLIAGCLVAGSLVAPAYAHGSGTHGKKKAGPNGGRVITKVTPNVEFFVTADRKVKLTFLDDAGKPVALSGQTATLTGGDRMNPTKLTFAAKDGALVSEQPLPAGDNVPVVLQLKMTPEASSVTEKFGVNFSTCPECKLSEYACTCDH